MPQRVRPVAKTYGNLTVVGRYTGMDKKNAYWMCKCVCGKEVVITGGALRAGARSSCGCSQRQFRLRPYESLYNWLVEHSTRYGKFGNLTYEEFVEFTKVKECHYCGSRVYWAEYSIHVNGNSYNLDRKDNRLGYTKDNCLVCCATCNRMKSDMSYAAFVDHFRRLTTHFRGR